MDKIAFRRLYSDIPVATPRAEVVPVSHGVEPVFSGKDWILDIHWRVQSETIPITVSLLTVDRLGNAADGSDETVQVDYFLSAYLSLVWLTQCCCRTPYAVS